MDRYGLVTEQKKGAYKYFVDLGDRMEVAGVKTVYLDEVSRSPLYTNRTHNSSFNFLICRTSKPKSRSLRCCMGCR
jgi:hypothetical protein